MTIYIDVLICINIIIDYFLINITGSILKTKCLLLRQVLGAVTGAMCSLSILIPQNLSVISYIIRFLSAPIIIYIVYGKANKKLFFQRVSCFLLCSFAFSGLFFVIFQIAKPQNLIVKGGVVYYNLSAVVLVLVSLVVYLLLTFIAKYFKTNNTLTKKVLVVCNETRLLLNCIIDTGSNLKEPFSEKPVLIINHRFQNKLNTDGLLTRVIPFYTVSNEGMFLGFRPNCAKLFNCSEEIPLDIYITFSHKNFADGIDGILPYNATNIL